jgi:hypothetical protein
MTESYERCSRCGEVDGHGDACGKGRTNVLANGCPHQSYLWIHRYTDAHPPGSCHGQIGTAPVVLGVHAWEQLGLGVGESGRFLRLSIPHTDPARRLLSESAEVLRGIHAYHSRPGVEAYHQCDRCQMAVISLLDRLDTFLLKHEEKT